MSFVFCIRLKHRFQPFPVSEFKVLFMLKLVERFVCSSHTSLFLIVSSFTPHILTFFSQNLHIPFSIFLHLLYFIYLVDVYLVIISPLNTFRPFFQLGMPFLNSSTFISNTAQSDRNTYPC